MLEITFISLLFVSLFGIVFILFRKIPSLIALPEADCPTGESIVLKIKQEIKKDIKKIPGAEKFDYELYLQKMLSKVRVLTIKTENKTGNWLEGLRKRRNGQNHNDEYWQELKKSKDGK